MSDDFDDFVSKELKKLKSTGIFTTLTREIVDSMTDEPDVDETLDDIPQELEVEHIPEDIVDEQAEDDEIRHPEQDD